MDANGDRVFYFHADASALGGRITHPRESAIEAPASCSLPQAGGSAKAEIGERRYDDVLRVGAARAHAAGAPRKEGGWFTEVTATTENLNLLGVVEADRLTARMLVEHPTTGYLPTVSHLESSIENLRIHGQRVDVALNPRLLSGSTHTSDTALPKHPDLLRTAVDQSR